MSNGGPYRQPWPPRGAMNALRVTSSNATVSWTEMMAYFLLGSTLQPGISSLGWWGHSSTQTRASVV